MNVQVARALDRLSTLLPLAARQHALTPTVRHLHRTILHAFAETGRPPIEAGADPAALRLLADRDLTVLGPDGEILGAYPFTLEHTPHLVLRNGGNVHAMCAVDALAISPVFGGAAVIRSRCAQSGEAMELHQDGESLDPGVWREAVVGIRWQAPGQCAAHSLCREMVFLKDGEAARHWRDSDDADRELFSLSDALALGGGFFRPLLGEGRR